MNSTSAEFWSLLQESGWLSRKKIDSLRKQIEPKTSIASSPAKIAQVLVANRLLTEPQARQLLSGQLTAAVEPPTAKPTKAPKPTVSHSHGRRKSNTLLAMAITVGLFFALGIGIWLAIQPADNEVAASNESPAASTSTVGSKSNDADATRAQDYYELVDDADALWARHEPGDAIEPIFAPAGVQTIVRIRLQDLIRHAEGQRILKSLGPTVQGLLSSWLSKLGTNSESIETLTLYLLPQGTTYPQVVSVANITDSALRKQLSGFGKRDGDGVAKLGADSIWFPKDSETTFIVGPSAAITSMVSNAKSNDSAGGVLLRRELEQLRRATHDTDHVTVLTNPNFLRDEAQDLFPDLRRRLLSGLYEFWSQEAQAVSLGLQLSNVSLAEVRMIAREDLPPRRLQGRVKSFMAKLPSTTSDFLGRAQLDPYWQPLALRFPTMLRFLSEQTRTQVEGKQVAINVVLPIEAIHNLALATELSSITPTVQVGEIQTVDRSDWKLEEVLAHKTSIRFAQKSLEQATSDVAQQIQEELRGLPFAFAIEIVGADLELDGITRNQQIRDFNIQNASVAEVLSALAVKANPTQNVAADSLEQKLVWVPQSDSGKVLVTTRSAARTKGLRLPAAFGSN